jgi:hypothetical protein
MSATDALRAFLTPLLLGWRLQYGRWIDDLKTDRYAVLRPMGGLPGALVRQPRFTLTLIGAADDAASLPETAAQTVISAMNTDAGGLVFMEPGEPVFWAANDGRSVVELSISTITNQT